MKKITLLFLCIFSFGIAQEKCKVFYQPLNFSYEGECKKGIANGKGIATGSIGRYEGEFKKGFPQGKGKLTYTNLSEYNGNFLDGYREGKGEMTYKIEKNGIKKDSIVSGYWCNDLYTGNKYITYTINPATTVSSYDVIPTKDSGSIINFGISTTSGDPTEGKGIFLRELSFYSGDSEAKILSNFDTKNKTTTTIQVKGFPMKLRARLSDNSFFEINMQKNANWKIDLYINK